MTSVSMQDIKCHSTKEHFYQSRYVDVLSPILVISDISRFITSLTPII